MICMTRYRRYLSSKSTISTSNGDCRREEKSRNHWSFFIKLLFSVTVNLLNKKKKNQFEFYLNKSLNKSYLLYGILLGAT